MDARVSAARNGQSVDGRVGAEFAPPAQTRPLPDESLPQLVGRLINDVSDLADRHIELAKQEIGEAKDETIRAAVLLAIGAGIAATSALLLVIWAWTGFIWFFNWLGAFVTIGPVTFAWLGWLLGLLVPAIAAWIAWRRFIRGGIHRARGSWPPLPRTRDALKENLAWVQHQRTRAAR
jgi:uncharacterized membrane protein YqjE